MFKLNQPFESERKISQSVIQVIEQLGMYHAELARILGQQCGDIGELSTGNNTIQRDSDAWHAAVLFINTYHELFDYFAGDGVAMYHWLRAHNKHLRGTPHLLIVDDAKLQIIYDYLLEANQNQI